MSEKFEARSHYGDWKGTVSADNEIHKGIHDFLKGKHLLSDGEFLVSFSLFTSEGFHLFKAHILPNVTSHENAQKAIQLAKGPLKVREVSDQLEPSEFLKMFKEFNIVLVGRDTGLKGLEYQVIEH